MAQQLSARKQIANAKARIEKLLADIETNKALIDSLAEQAKTEPEEFDGASVPSGSNVTVKLGNGDSAKVVDAVVVARKEATAGSAAVKDDEGKELVAAKKGTSLMFKVRYGSGFDEETAIVYPGQITGYRTITA